MGMIQSRDDSEDDKLFDVGCAGRKQYSETDDGRMLITCQFYPFSSIDCDNGAAGYRLARISWSEFKSDLVPCETEICREHLIEVLRHCFNLKGYTVDWDNIQNCEDEKLVSTLSMICPFEVSEKQAFLRVWLASRADLLIAILEMASHSENDEQAQNTNLALLSLLVCPANLSVLIYDKGHAELVGLQTPGFSHSGWCPDHDD